MSSVSSRTADLPLRPLLFADGAAATAVSIYCSVTQGDGDKTAAEQENKTFNKVWEQTTELAQVRSAEVHQNQMTVSIAKADEKHQKYVETIAQLEKERSDLTRQVETLRDNMKEMGDLLHKHDMESANLTKACVQEWEELLKVSVAEAEEKLQKSVEIIARLEEEKSELMKEVEALRDTVKECERVQEAHSLLHTEINRILKTLIHENKVSVAEAKERHQKDVEEERADLMKQVETLRDTVKEWERERETHSLLQVSVTEAEKKHQRSVETITQLQEEKSDLAKQVETLKDNVEALGHLLYKHNMESANLTQVCVQEWEEIVKVSMAEAEEKHQKSVETIAQLKEEKFDLTEQVKMLRDAVKECEREREAHSLLQVENKEMMKTLILQQEFLRVSLDKAEEKSQKNLVVITQLEKEKYDLMKQVERLRDMGHLLIDRNLKFANLTKVFEKERDDLLKVSLGNGVEKHQYDVETITQLEEERSNLRKQLERLRDMVQNMRTEIQKTHQECDEFIIAKAEEKQQRALEIIAQLEEEKSVLSEEVETLRITVQDMGNHLYEMHRECDRLTDEGVCLRSMFGQEQEAHRILQSEYHDLKRKQDQI